MEKTDLKSKKIKKILKIQGGGGRGKLSNKVEYVLWK